MTNVRNATDLPDLTVYRVPVEQFLEEVKARGALRKVRVGIKQQETKELQELRFEGRQKVSQLRAAIKAHLGMRNPRLLEFGMRPIGKRTRRGEPAEEPPQPEIPAPAADPEVPKP